MNFNDPRITTFDIHLSHHDKARNIRKIMKNVTDYCYAFIHTSGVMKYGMSVDKKGERIYRQAWHIPGWKTPCSEKMSGHDMKDIVDTYYPKIHKDEVVIRVWDLSSITFLQNNNHKHEVIQFENHLIETHINITKSKPPGNYRTESYIKNQHVVSDDLWEDLFQGTL